MEVSYVYIVIIFILFYYHIRKINLLSTNNATLQDELDSTEHELSALVKMYDDNVIASKMDLEGKITYASRGFCQACEYTEDELIGQPYDIVTHPDSSPEPFKNMWEALHEDRTWQGELYNLSKNGNAYWVENIVVPEYNRHGKKIGYNSIRHDITAKKDLENLTLTLEKKVKERTKELEELSITDSLTSLYNRRYFETIIAQEFQRSKRDKANFIFSIFDIDMFKQYNDNYGHIQGDEVLINISKILLQLTQRANDFAFRVGGEEFCIITSAMSEEEALAYFNKIKQSIEDAQIEHCKSLVAKHVTASFGLVIVDLSKLTHTVFDERYDVDNIHKLADKLLYQAKNEGRNRIIHEVM